jgi:hypothetical protein
MRAMRSALWAACATPTQRLEETGMVSRGTGHVVRADQPVALTDAGRAALLAVRRPPTNQVPKSPDRPGAWPSPHTAVLNFRKALAVPERAGTRAEARRTSWVTWSSPEP